MRKFKVFLSLFVAILLLCVFPLTAFASDTSETLYKNDFENGIIDDSFVVNHGTLNVVSEKGEKFLRCTHESNRIQFAYGPTDQRNVDISFRIRATTIVNATTATISPFFRSPHIPAWDTVSYQLQFKTYETSLIYADRFADDNTLAPIATYPDFAVSVGLWNNVQISTRGERIIVYVNGELLFETIDTNYGEYGGFGFAALQASFDIDDLVISRHYGERLPEPTLNEKPLWMGDLMEKEEADIPDTGIVRIDLTNLGQNKAPVSNAINYIDPTKPTTFTWIILALAVLCAATATTGFVIAIINKGGKQK